jgi:hypothetical protein
MILVFSAARKLGFKFDFSWKLWYNIYIMRKQGELAQWLILACTTTLSLAT